MTGKYADCAIDWNGGIRSDCEFCGDDGFVYHVEWSGRNMAMCDQCRDDIDRRIDYSANLTAKTAKAGK